MAEYIIFVLKKQPLYFPCKKCNTPNLYIKCTKIEEQNNRIKVEKSEEENEKNIILKNISIGIANLLIDYMNLNKLKIIKYNKIIINKINQQNNSLNINSNISLGNPPRKGAEYNKNKGENINVIYYDEDNKKERPIPNIYFDSNLFERVIPYGSFILVTDEKRLNLVMEELKKNDTIDFNLIVSGSKCKKIMEKLSNENKNIIKNGCIYTTNIKKYKKLIEKEKYDIINHIYTEEDEIISFINDNKSNTEVFKTYKLINYNNYIDNYYYFHKLISDQYNEEILEDGNAYECSVAILQDINQSRNFDIGTLSEYLKMIKNQNQDIRKGIVKEYMMTHYINVSING